MERDDNTACLWMGDWQGEHRARFVETVLGERYTYVSSDAWVTAFQSCCLWTGKDLGLGLGEGKVKGCKDLCS